MAGRRSSGRRPGCFTRETEPREQNRPNGSNRMAFDKIFLNARFDGGARHHIAVKDGLIAALLPADAPASGTETVDLGNALVVPGFIEGHIHLDTSFYGDAWRPHKPCTNG